MVGGAMNGTEFSNLARIAVRLMEGLNWSKKEIVRIPYLQSRYGRNWIGGVSNTTDLLPADPTGISLLLAMSYRGLRGLATIGVMQTGHLPPARSCMTAANHMIAPNIRIDQNGRAVIIGLDKLEHFFQQGFWYFAFQKQTRWADHPRTRRQFGNFMEGFKYNNTLKAEFERVSQSFQAGFHEGKFGLASTGIASFGDANANESGYQFYVRMENAYRDWAKNGGTGVFPGRFLFSEINVKTWSEFVTRGNEYRGTLPDDIFFG